MLALTSLFVFTRTGIHISRYKPFEVQDSFIYLAYVSYLALWICYRIVINPMFRAYAVYNGEVPPYPTIIYDASQMLRLITAAQMCFYTALPGVKLSLLTLYRKLFKGLPSTYHNTWWGIIVVVILVSKKKVYARLFTNLLTLCSRGLAVYWAAVLLVTTSTPSSIREDVLARQMRRRGSYSVCTLLTLPTS